MKQKASKKLAIRQAQALQDSPLGNLLLEDAAASKQHGRTTARVGVGPDGNPIVYSTDVATREAIQHAIEQRQHVNYMDIPKVTALDFQRLLRDGSAALEARAPLPPVTTAREVPPLVVAPFVLTPTTTIAQVREMDEWPSDDSPEGTKCRLCGNWISKGKEATTKDCERHYYEGACQGVKR